MGSTAVSSVDTDFTSRQKSSRKGRRNNRIDISNRKISKKNECNKKPFVSYVSLVNRNTHRSEYFKLYKDREIGIEKELQTAIQECSFDDDCQTDNEQIVVACNTLEKELLTASNNIIKAEDGINEYIKNFKYVPVLEESD